MIYRIQPAGFGWNWCESAHIGVNQKKKKKKRANQRIGGALLQVRCGCGTHSALSVLQGFTPVKLS